MCKCYSTDHFAEDHTNTDITSNIEEPQQYRIGTVSNRLLEVCVCGGGGGGGR